MKLLFCKISAMKYYKGASQKDVPYNGGSYVNENGFGNEQYNFAAVQLDDGRDYCLGFVETKTTSKTKRNELHIEKIDGCELIKKEDCRWCFGRLVRNNRFERNFYYRVVSGCHRIQILSKC